MEGRTYVYEPVIMKKAKDVAKYEQPVFSLYRDLHKSKACKDIFGIRAIDIDAFNASTDSRDFGTEIVKEVKILEGCDKVKVIYINQASLVPMIGMYEIE
jgi:hypothetical protein